nr:adenosylcobinamide-GDP ribazoletransferase [Alkalicoccus luteus]
MQFLTRVPVPVQADWNEASARWALRFYPLIGLLIGLPAAALASQNVTSSAVTAALILTYFIWISGALHLDGWMDTFDAVGSNAPLDRKWEIMQDPRVGSFGMVSVIVLLLWKLLLIYELLTAGMNPWLFLLIPSAGRMAAVYLLVFTKTAHADGLAAVWKQHTKPVDAWIAALPLAAACFAAGTAGIAAGAALLLFCVCVRGWYLKHFNGINGDLAGASIEGGELWILTVLFIWTLFVMV